MDQWIATLDGVRDGVILCTILKDARGTPLTGQYVALPMGVDLLLGRLGPIDLTNPIHEDPAFKPYLMVHGRVQQWSQEVDIEQSTIQVIGMVNAKDERIPQQAWPPTGTRIALADAEAIARLFNEKEERLRLVLGKIPNTAEIPATVINRHFGAFEQGGYGEARHEVVYGQNGSGKTVWALQRLVGRLAAHPNMGLLMPDTAGDLSDATRHNRGAFRWNYLDVLAAAGVQPQVLDIADIRMTSATTLKYLFERPFIQHLSMRPDVAATLADRVVYQLFEDKPVTSEHLTSEAVLDAVIANIASCYAQNSRTQKTNDAKALKDEAHRRRMFERDFARVCQFFDGRELLRDLIQGILEEGRKVIIRMDSSAGLSESEQGYVMREVMAHLTHRAEVLFKRERRGCNALVVLDEGTRWVPEDSDEDRNDTARLVKRAFRETRKYGVGWMIIAQRISEVAKTVLSQAHMRWFGRGLGVGNDRVHLEQQLGKEGMAAYERLELQGGFFWVGTGHDNNLGTEGNFCTVHPFAGDATQALMDANPAIFRRRH